MKRQYKFTARRADQRARQHRPAASSDRATSAKPASRSSARDLVGEPRAAAPHREQVKAEIGVAHRLGAARARHRLGDQQRAAGRQAPRERRAAAPAPIRRRDRAAPARARSTSAPRGSGSSRKSAAVRPRRASRGPRAREPRARPRGDRRQIEELERRARARARAAARQEGALAAADVEQAAVAGERIGVENVLGDQRPATATSGRCRRRSLGAGSRRSRRPG